jgi:hypothetical protein
MKLEAEIAAIRAKTAEREACAAELATQHPGAIVLRSIPRNDTRPWLGAAIHPSSRTAGRWQVSCFDADGFAYDYSEPTYQAAIYSALQAGYDTVDMGLLDSVISTAQFMAGVVWSMLPDDKKWTTRIADIRAELAVQP